MLTGFDRATVAADDFESAVSDYARLLGRSPSFRAEKSGEWGVASAIFRVENASLHLIGVDSAGSTAPAIEERLREQGEGLFGMSFAADDAALATRWLRDRGMDALDPLEGEATEVATGLRRQWKTAVLPPSSTREVAISVTEHVDEDVPLAPLAVDTREAVHRLDHIVISSGDLDASRDLYRDRLGLRLALDRSFEKRGIRILFFRIGGVTVEVVGSLDPSRAGTEDRFGGLAWQVEDVGRIRERLGHQGFDVSEERAGHKPGTRVCTVGSQTHGVPTLLIGPDSG